MYKTKKIALVILIGSAALAGLAWIARPTPTTQNADLAAVAYVGLTADENGYDFGTISMKDGDVSHKFIVRNISDEPIPLNKLYTSCMCTSASLLMGERKVGPFGMPGHGFIPSFKETLEPGAEIEIEAIFDPTAHGPAGIGRIERTIFLDSGGRTVLELGISASVRP